MNIIPWNGLPITEPGIYSGIPIDTYHSLEIMPPGVRCISSTGVRTAVGESGAHFWDSSVYNPNRKERGQTESMILGRAAHHLLLGEADFRRSFVVQPATYIHPKDGEKDWNNNATVCRNWKKLQAEAKLTVITDGQVEKIKGMAASMARHPMIKAGALSGYIEHSFFWRDEETGLWLKWRPDALPEGSLDVFDLKCVSAVDFDSVERSIGDYLYNVQGAMGRAAFRAILGVEMTSFSLLCVESTRPHCVAPFELETGGHTYSDGQTRESAMDLGERQLRAGLNLIAKGFATGEWSGPGGTVSDARSIGLNKWAQKQAEMRLAEIEQELAA